eukprot:CAMPEP_0172447238 /NCGR_PEP_ID=MMETSP1065-20121228/6583_1 /TAXON_ID=265537 /ORGANISM="Amphiprora paludosa, Strain CCMP125" /LENGTH=155 /DNA_ID=CAMNT_0013198483 /DNA_START=487 /DNA_END=954 /DNA_ORIENTATION=+
MAPSPPEQASQEALDVCRPQDVKRSYVLYHLLLLAITQDSKGLTQMVLEEGNVGRRHTPSSDGIFPPLSSERGHANLHAVSTGANLGFTFLRARYQNAVNATRVAQERHFQEQEGWFFIPRIDILESDPKAVECLRQSLVAAVGQLVRKGLEQNA